MINKKTSNFAVFLFFALFWFSILYFTGALSPGFHLQDDHLVLRASHELESGASLFNVTHRLIIKDFLIRFRPVYFLHFMLETYLFGTNFTIWSIYTGFLAVVTAYLLFLFFNNIGFSKIESILFPLMTMVGKQAVIWWSFSCNEIIGMLFLSMTLFFMAAAINSKKHQNVLDLFFIVCVLLMSFSKESFILLIPALLFWKIWLTKNKHVCSWFDSLRKNALAASFLILTMAMELLFIIRAVGVGGYGHGGGLDGFKPLLYLVSILTISFSASSVSYGLVSLFGILLLVYFRNDGRKTIIFRGVDFLRDFRNPIILFMLFAGPQFVLYARSGFYAHYLLPLVMGFSILLLYLLRFSRENKDNYLFIFPAQKTKKTFVLSSICILIGLFLLAAALKMILAGFFRPKIILLVIVGICGLVTAGILLMRRERKLAIVCVIYFITVAFVCYKIFFFMGAYEYAMQGKENSLFLGEVAKNTSPESPILIVGDHKLNDEAIFSVAVYLNLMKGRKNLYFYSLQKDVEKSIEVYHENRYRLLKKIDDPRLFKYIIVFTTVERQFPQNAKTWLPQNYDEVVKTDSMKLFLNKFS